MDLLELNNFVTEVSSDIAKRVIVSDSLHEQGKKHQAEIYDAEIRAMSNLLNRFIVFCRKQNIMI